jgi:hypothetical protein
MFGVMRVCATWNNAHGGPSLQQAIGESHMIGRHAIKYRTAHRTLNRQFVVQGYFAVATSEVTHINYNRCCRHF